MAGRLVRYIALEKERAARGHDIPTQPDKGNGLMRDRHAVDAALFGVGRLLCQRRLQQVRLR